MRERIKNILECKQGQLKAIIKSLDFPNQKKQELKKNKIEIKAQISILELLLKE